MSFLERLPVLDRCCGCFTDLKTATAIIAVLGIVTSPAISWAIVRHGYVVRVSCGVSSNNTSPDVVDINLSHALSFGFGANAGLGASCLSKRPPKIMMVNGTEVVVEDKKTSSFFVKIVKYSGWIIFLADVVFLIASINLILILYRGADDMATLFFIMSGLVSVILTFIYGILYIIACIYVGGTFPVLEFLFAFIDLIIWMHFLYVVFSYYQQSTGIMSISPVLDNSRLPRSVLMILGLFTIYGFCTNFRIFQRYCYENTLLCLIFSVALLSNGGVILQTKISVGVDCLRRDVLGK